MFQQVTQTIASIGPGTYGFVVLRRSPRGPPQPRGVAPIVDSVGREPAPPAKGAAAPPEARRNRMIESEVGQLQDGLRNPCQPVANRRHLRAC